MSLPVSKPNQASQRPIGEGRRLRWARNVVRQWENERRELLRRHKVQIGDANDIFLEIRNKRYERACALIVAQKLKQ